MRKIFRNKKALSPVVAAIILIAVTVAVSIAVAAWMGALTISFMKTEELKIVGVDFNGDGAAGTVVDTIDIHVRNTGTVTATITDAKVGDTIFEVDDHTINPGDDFEVTGVIYAWVNGTAYNVAVVTKAGNIYPYRATAPSET